VDVLITPRDGYTRNLDDRGRTVLAVLDESAAGHQVPVSVVALRRDQPDERTTSTSLCAERIFSS
jgi:hypothetical protein